MMEKAYKPQFYKALNYSQQRDIIPKRRREWAGERVSQLEKVKLYEHPEDYKDMMYSLAVPESNPIYPTFRAETGQWRHPSFDVLMRRPEAEAEEAVFYPQLLILNFDGADGATTYVEEISDLTPSVNSNVALDSDEAKFGPSSLLMDSAAFGRLQYNTIMSYYGDITLHGWYTFDSFPSVNGHYQKIFYAWGSGDNLPSIDFGLTANGGGTPKLIIYILDKSGNVVIDVDLTNPFSLGTRHHVALVVNGQNYMYFIDGLRQGLWTATIDSPHDDSNVLEFAISTPSGGKYWIDAFEFLNGARWTEDFTPPSNPPARGVLTV